ncbi:MAG: hypothetical protein IPM74_15360 [Crocinitomicaceae bacterium]|nr:hypothetical protein [Crocinitomicaceae bacterium]MBK8927248.1 hypothetical protein [Crocinitomicaceae bacterium]
MKGIIFFSFTLALCGNIFSQIEFIECNYRVLAKPVSDLSDSSMIVGNFDPDSNLDTIIAVKNKSGQTGFMIYTHEKSTVVAAGSFTEVGVKYGKKIIDPTDIQSIHFDSWEFVSKLSIMEDKHKKGTPVLAVDAVRDHFKKLKITPDSDVLVLTWAYENLFCFFYINGILFMAEIYNPVME